MELHFTSKLDEYYRKFIELQEQLKRSEEQRFVLEMKFNDMVQVAKEEEQQHYRKLRAQYKRFLEEDKKRQDRNERIIRNLERIETRIAMLSAKTERINLLRKQYQNFLLRIANGNPQRTPREPGMSRERSFIREEPLKEQRANSFKDDFSLPQRHNDPLLTVKKDHQSNEEKIEILDRYLQSLSSQRCRDLINQENEAGQKLALGTQQDVYWKGEPATTNHATSIADDIMNSIYSRYYNKNDDGSTRGGHLNLGTVRGQNDLIGGATNLVGDVNYPQTGNTFEGNLSMPSDCLKNDEDVATVDTTAMANVEEASPEHTVPINMDDFESKNCTDPIDQQNIKLKEQTDDTIVSSVETTKNDDALLKTEPEEEEEEELPISQRDNPIVDEALNEHEASNEPDKNLIEHQQNDIVDFQHDYDQRTEDNHADKVDDHEGLGDDNVETIEETNEQQDTGDDNVKQFVQHQEHNNNYYRETDQTLYQTDPALYHQQQYDENGQPIQQGYDQYGQFMLYDQNGQMVQPQYDQHGQIIPQYDESGQLMMLYDQNGHQQYDENGQPFLQYDTSGQPLYGYDFGNQDGLYQTDETASGLYQEYEADAPEGDTQLQQDVQPKEAELDEGDDPGNESAKQHDGAGDEGGVEKVAKVMDILDTDTDSSKQNNTSKISNDTDFDFS